MNCCEIAFFILTSRPDMDITVLPFLLQPSVSNMIAQTTGPSLVVPLRSSLLQRPHFQIQVDIVSVSVSSPLRHFFQADFNQFN